MEPLSAQRPAPRVSCSTKTTALVGRSLRRFVHVGSWLLLCLAFLGLSGFGAGSGQKKQVPEYRLKAAFLYNFALFTDWPKESFDDARSPLVVAVVGKDPFGEHLEQTFRKKKAKGRPIELARFKSVGDVGHCHILFVPATEAPRIKEIQKQLGKRHVLIVGESKDFALQGGCVNFYRKKKSIAFEVNPKAAKRAKLTISSRLLKLARIVVEKGKRVDGTGAAREGREGGR